MIFAKNLQYLRQEKGYTQEQMAEKLLVSRQSVSKWESAGSYPEMEKILQICDLFQCNMDVLMQGDVKQHLDAEKSGYDKHMNQRSKMVSVGVGLIITGAAAYECIVGVSATEFIANMVFMLIAVIGIIVLVVAGLQHEEFKRQKIQIVNPYTEKEVNKFQKKYINIVACAIALILFGVILSSGAEGFKLSKPFNEEFIYGIFLMMVAVAVGLLTYAGMQKEKYHMEENSKEKEAQENKKHIQMCGVIMLIATGIFLLGGVVGNRWDISWVAFPVGGIACGIAYILISRE